MRAYDYKAHPALGPACDALSLRMACVLLVVFIVEVAADSITTTHLVCSLW